MNSSLNGQQEYKESEEYDSNVIPIVVDQKKTIKLSLFLIFVLSFTFHFGGLGSPNQVIFDEVHLGKHINTYCCSKKRYFDVHPPIGKMILAGGAAISGYEGGESFKRIGGKYQAAASSWQIRWLPSLLGSLMPLVLYGLIRLMGGGHLAGLFGAISLVFENGHLTHSRFAQVDSILWFFSFGGLLWFLWSQKFHSKIKRALCSILTGVFLGIAIGSKLTALAMFGLVTLIIFRKCYQKLNFEKLKSASWEFLIVSSSLLIVYTSGWALHWKILDQPGKGDRFYKVSNVLSKDMLVVHKKIMKENHKLKKKHVDRSKAIVWPIMRNIIYYWKGKNRRIYLVGNPIVWLGSSMVLITMLILGAIGPVSKVNLPPPPPSHKEFRWVALIGFLSSYLPMFFITRTMFIYHYFVPLFFALIIVPLWLERAGVIPNSKPFKTPRHLYIASLAFAFGFLVVTPLTYGWDISGIARPIHDVIKFLFHT